MTNPLEIQNQNENKISDNMKDFNKIREADLLDNWCKILKKKDNCQGGKKNP